MSSNQQEKSSQSSGIGQEAGNGGQKKSAPENPPATDPSKRTVSRKDGADKTNSNNS
ncbi:hypothetical protein [Nostoc sp. 'Peltigera membranacea cyanobiont' N6]|uniref:hypothetical protein n=1 Tax=Nostoc sp. 'Peltigera membranacea cyanobiont' N6 TaxID=1261031 RepID=UPI0015E46F20|nr:hypothetical protein [Nostoc sp. 'Peltigera membranacea cyanobiont' N6]